MGRAFVVAAVGGVAAAAVVGYYLYQRSIRCAVTLELLPADKLNLKPDIMPSLVAWTPTKDESTGKYGVVRTDDATQFWEAPDQNRVNGLPFPPFISQKSWDGLRDHWPTKIHRPGDVSGCQFVSHPEQLLAMHHRAPQPRLTECTCALGACRVDALGAAA